VFGVALVFFPITNIASRLVGKKVVMSVAIVLFAVCNALIYFLGTDVLILAPVTQGLLIFGLIGIPVSALLLVPNAMIADIAEYDAILTGSRREAMCFSAQGFLEKINLGTSALVLAFLLSRFGKDLATPLGVKLSGPVAAAVCLVGLVGFILYPERRVMDVLEAHRKGEKEGR